MTTREDYRLELADELLGLTIEIKDAKHRLLGPLTKAELFDLIAKGEILQYLEIRQRLKEAA